MNKLTPAENTLLGVVAGTEVLLVVQPMIFWKNAAQQGLAFRWLEGGECLPLLTTSRTTGVAAAAAAAPPAWCSLPCGLHTPGPGDIGTQGVWSALPPAHRATGCRHCVAVPTRGASTEGWVSRPPRKAWSPA
jgi:hypothetical protein